jgi:uncharacterized membrane protein
MEQPLERSEPSEPSAPATARARAASDLLALQNRFGTIARSVTLTGAMGAALVFWAVLTFRRGVKKLVVDNELDAALRMQLIYLLLGGAVVGALAGGALLFLAKRRSVPFASVERWCWFASPLLLMPWLPILYRHSVWKDRDQALPPVALVAALMTEVLLYHSFTSAPEQVLRWWALARERAPIIWRRHGPLAVVIAGSLFYVVFMTFFDLRWHYKLRTHNFDVSINNHLLYNGLHGRFFETTVTHAAEPGEYIAAHAKIGGYLFLPLYALYPKPEFLLALQCTSLGLGAIPLFLFARKRLSDWMAAAVAGAYLCYHPMHSANFYEVNWVPIASFFVLGTVWAIDARRWVTGALLFVAGALMREDMPIGFAVIGACLLLTGHRPKAGLIIALVSTIWFVILRFYIMDSAGDWWFPKMYKGLWPPGEKGFKSVIKTLVTNPVFVLGKLITEAKVNYLLHLLVPISFLPARRWYLWAAFIPGTILTLLATDYKPLTMYTFQYVMHWTPYLFLAAALALSAIAREADFGLARMRAAAGGMLLAASALSYNYGAFTAHTGTVKGGYFAVEFEFTDAERERYGALRELIKMIPDEASVSATEIAGPHVSSRKLIYAMRAGTQNADYLLIESRKLKLGRTRESLRKALESRQYGLLARRADFGLFKKGHDPSKNAQIIQEWGL